MLYKITFVNTEDAEDDNDEAKNTIIYVSEGQFFIVDNELVIMAWEGSDEDTYTAENGFKVESVK